MAQRNGTAPSTKELRALVRSGSRTPGRSEAFIELVAREPQGLNRTLRSLALDPQTDQAMRVKAVAALGRKATSSSLDALRAAMHADDETVRSRAIERLGKVGAPDDLARLEKLRSDDHTTQRALHTARLFLSYRHRLGANRLDAPEHGLASESSDAAQIRTGGPTKAMNNRMQLIAAPVPGVKLAPRPAARLVCGTREFALMMNQDLLGEGLATLAQRQGLLAVLVTYNNELGAYEPLYYFMTDPAGEGGFRVLGVRSRGRVGLQGTGTVAGASIGFEVSASEEPLEHPVSVRGTYDSEAGTVRFDLALVDPRFSAEQQSRRKQPRPTL